MHIGRFDFPDDLYFDKEHGWARVEGDIVTHGLTEFGQAIAQEIVYAEAPRAGRTVEQGQTFMSMESGKWVGRVKAIVSGEVLEFNEELEWEASLINTSPYDKGWVVKIKASNPGELANLWKADSPDLKAFIEAATAQYAEVLGG
jgi:glycine cleavage system H protein